ncbi:uncharacterized protein LOC113790596 [Dermatophagoides pteronyssinus]|uniref:uncharacterized protein LOC113790596 n=1 Tax=Dermatophagoides pteronyssinus TaxID=6956 RepID=UPI003F669132
MNRAEYYTHIDIISVEMLDKLIEDDYVLIINKNRALSLKEYYPSTGFHVSKDSMIPTLGTYAMRSTIDNDNRIRLSRLFKSLSYYGLLKFMDRRLFLNHLRARAEDELVNHNEEKVLNYKKLPKTRILSGQTIVTFMYLFLTFD